MTRLSSNHLHWYWQQKLTEKKLNKLTLKPMKTNIILRNKIFPHTECSN